MNRFDSVCITLYMVYLIFITTAAIAIRRYDKKKPGYLWRVDHNAYANKFEYWFLIVVGLFTYFMMFVGGVHLIYIIFRVISHFLHVL